MNIHKFILGIPQEPNCYILEVIIQPYLIISDSEKQTGSNIAVYLFTHSQSVEWLLCAKLCAGADIKED